MIIPAPAMFLAQCKVLLALDLANTRQGLLFLSICESLVLGPTLLDTSVPGVL